MSKIVAPEIEPGTAEEKKQVPRPRGKYIDFAPRRKKKPVARSPKITVVLDTPVEDLTVGDVIAKEPMVDESIADEPIADEPMADEPIIEETTIAIAPEDEFAGLEEAFVGSDEEEYDDGPMAEFNNFDDDFVEEAQEDFLASDNDDNYVEEVLSKFSETKTETTTVRRSPFLKNYHIEKRPLSSHVPVREKVPSVEALEPTPHKEFKEEVFARHADPAPENAEAPVKTEEEKTGSKLGMILTIFITVLLGAGVGVFVYLAFFK